MTYNPYSPPDPARRPKRLTPGSEPLRRYAENSLPYMLAFAANGIAWALNAHHEPLLKRDKTTGRWHGVRKTTATPRIVARIRLYDTLRAPWVDTDTLHALEHMLATFRKNHC